MKGRKRWDMALLAALVLAGLVLAAAVLLGRERGASAVVLVDGRETARFSLSEDMTYEIVTPEGRNLLEIRGGLVRLTEADCPDLLCVKQGAIRYVGDSIICLPHKVVVELRGEDDMALDAVAK